jgi:hypothetical protein
MPFVPAGPVGPGAPSLPLHEYKVIDKAIKHVVKIENKAVVLIF